MRARVNWTSGWSRIAQLPAGERYEDVLEGGVVGREQRKLGAPPFQEPKQRGHGAMHLGHREGGAIEPRAHRAHARERGEPSAMTVPWSMMATRSHRRSASSI